MTKKILQLLQRCRIELKYGPRKKMNLKRKIEQNVGLTIKLPHENIDDYGKSADFTAASSNVGLV